MDKETLRIKYHNIRKALSQEEVSEKSQAIANQLLSLPIWKASYYSLFLSMAHKKEVDTSYILTVLQAHDKEICLPKVAAKQQLNHFLLTDNLLIKPNKWGIPEPQNGLEVPPKKIDLVFVPLLAFDYKGNRLGYGKGFYDRFLSQCRRETLKIGLSFFEAETEEIPTEPTDVPLHYCVTPKKIYSF